MDEPRRRRADPTFRRFLIWGGSAAWVLFAFLWTGRMPQGRSSAGMLAFLLAIPLIVLAVVAGGAGFARRKRPPQRPPRDPNRVVEPSEIRLRHSRPAAGPAAHTTVLIRLGATAYVLGGGALAWHFAGDDPRLLGGLLFLGLAVPVGVIVLRDQDRAK